MPGGVNGGRAMRWPGRMRGGRNEERAECGTEDRGAGMSRAEYERRVEEIAAVAYAECVERGRRKIEAEQAAESRPVGWDVAPRYCGRG
jgi:hypothetical protein